MLLFAANKVKWVWEVSGEREVSKVSPSGLCQENREVYRRRKPHSLLGLRRKGSQPAPISLLHSYRAPTVYKALSQSLQRF